MSVELTTEIEQEIIGAAQEIGFENVELRKHLYRFWAAAESRDLKSVTFLYNFLQAAPKLYEIHPELLRKSAKVLSLHERKHHEPTPLRGDDYETETEVNRRAVMDYGNPIEFFVLDSVPYLINKKVDRRALQKSISIQLEENYSFLSPSDKEQITTLMTDPNFYKDRNLRKFLKIENHGRLDRLYDAAHKISGLFQ